MRLEDQTIADCSTGDETVPSARARRAADLIHLAREYAHRLPDTGLTPCVRLVRLMGAPKWREPSPMTSR